MFSKSIMILILGTLIKWIIANMEAKSKGKTGTFKLNIYSAVSFDMFEKNNVFCLLPCVEAANMK